jgi:RNase H-fold protein (predicted Holliday junction resolvase)/ribosomal protein L29
LSKILKGLDIPFLNLKPEDDVLQDLALVLTTKKEKNLVKYHKVVCVEELGKDLNEVKANLLNLIYGKEGRLVIGIDPGKRIGMVAFYKDIEVDKGVYNSHSELVESISSLIKKIGREKIVKIGDGDMISAKRIAEMLKRRFKRLRIEIVDERGTSANVRIRVNKRGTKDEESARMIAFREGKAYE